LWAISAHVLDHALGLRVSLGMGLVALVMVAIAENGRVPIDNPATHLELTMVHEAMVLEYSGRHLALIEAAAMLKLLALHLADRLHLRPLGAWTWPAVWADFPQGLASYLGKAGGRRRAARPVRDEHRQDARLSRRRSSSAGRCCSASSPSSCSTSREASDDAQPRL